MEKHRQLFFNFFVVPHQSAEVISTPKNLEIHPSVRRHLGKTPRSHSSQDANSGFLSKSFSAGQSASEEGSAEFNQLRTISDTVKKEPNVESNGRGMENCQDHLMARVKTEVHADSKSQVQEEGGSESAKNEDSVSSRPPSPKYLPPKPPDNPQTIVQGRHQRFQAKKRYFQEFGKFSENLISLFLMIFKHKFCGTLILVYPLFCLSHPSSCPAFDICVCHLGI